MYVLAINYCFSRINSLKNQQTKFQHKICFKPHMHFLKLKTTPSIAIANRVMHQGKFLKIYKLLLKWYLLQIIPIVKKLPDGNEFKNIFIHYPSFNNLNSALFWKIMLVNVVFNLKQLGNKKIVYYLKPERRIPLALSWLKYLIKLSKKNTNNCSINLFNKLTKFLCTNSNKNSLFFLKIKIYKLKLIRS